MRKELKDQIKQDELTTGLEQAAAWAARHRDELRIGGLVFLVLAGAALAITHVREQRLREGDRALRDALTTFEAPLASELPPGAERPAGQVFPSAEEKYKTAAAAFEGVARRYPSSTAGVRADVLRRAVAARARAVRRGREGAQGAAGARRGSRARPRAAGARRLLQAQRSGRQGRRGVPLLREQPFRQPAARPGADERGADARGRPAFRRGPRGLPSAHRGVPGQRLRRRRRGRAPSTSPSRAEPEPS